MALLKVGLFCSERQVFFHKFLILITDTRTCFSSVGMLTLDVLDKFQFGDCILKAIEKSGTPFHVREHMA